MLLRYYITGFCLIWIILPNNSCKKENNDFLSVTEFNQVIPQNGEKGISLNPTFSWESANNVENYTLAVSKDSTFTDLVIEERGLTGNQYVASKDLENNTKYYWRVTAVNKNGILDAKNADLYFRTLSVPASPSPNISKYFVSPLGYDNPGWGTFDRPFKTLAYTLTIVPGSENDTVFLLPGTFYESEPSIVPVGVTILGSGKDVSILSSKGVGNAESSKNSFVGTLIQLVSPHDGSPVIAPSQGNQALSGFSIDGNQKALKAGIWVENRNNVTLTNVSIRNCYLRGAVFAPGMKEWYNEPAYYMNGIVIKDCEFTNCGKDQSDETLGNLCIAQLDGAEIFNIKITDNEGYGIKFIYDGFFRNTKIHDCEINLNETDAKWGEDIAIELWNCGPGNEVYNINCNTWISIVNHPEVFPETGILNMKLHDIKMIDKDGQSNKEAVEIGTPGVEIYNSYFENKGIGIAIWNMGRKDITIRNNIFSNSFIHNNWAAGSAIFIANSHDWNFADINIYNNVFDTFYTGIYMKQESNTSYMENILVRNNVFLGITNANIKLLGTVNKISVQNNLKDNGNSLAWIAGASVSITENDNLIGNPGFAMTGNKWENWYKASSSISLVIDKGMDVGILYKGAAPDIGRWEF